ncbi:hypothetical protein [Methylobacter sp. S3L5C]|uniref:hypothetical protein n=1 Tax=Methylobacter sp. S3L5C TaxID=2839024 RepID=UPI001FAB9430|nr:hypothetical protein [Methylobacter sp. S3L5C]UOA07218.1 hypothetical protein KKZ03_13010 [Methylobacter sp. S3L5C]
MGGTINVSSQPGEGSVAEFTLWLREKAETKSDLNTELEIDLPLLLTQPLVNRHLS